MVEMKEIKDALEEIGIPSEDPKDLSKSGQTFPDGGHYRMEISGVERPSTLEALIEEREKRDIPVHRLISTVMGSTLLTDDELEDFARMAKESEMEVIITPGPRASWNTGRQIATPEGALSGLRVRGMDNMIDGFKDIKRCIDFGFRGFLVTDEGMLWVADQLKQKGLIPDDVTFKVSIYAGHANPAGGKLLEDLGAGTFNPTADLSIPMFASIRKAIDIPIDIHIYLADSMGGFNRFYEGPDLARVASPCYFKIEPGSGLAAGGGIYKPWTDPNFLANFAKEKVKYAEIIHDIIQDKYPDLKLSEHGCEGLAIPQP
ncbi:MAG: hypothetical protein ACOC53_02035 [Candidatus Saliniplasma sp.]